jgi:hypothetical protein
MAIYSRDGNVKVLKGRITSVDKVKYTCTVVDLQGGVHDGIAAMPMYLNSSGGGMYWQPEVNTVVWLMKPSSARTPFILGAAPVPKQTDAGDDSEDPNDYRMNRPVVNEGDQVLSSSEGNFIILRKGGVIEIGATQNAQRLYIPIANSIIDLVENYTLDTTGGKFSFRSRREDDSHGTDKSPVELRLQVKEFAEEDPIIDVGLGRIAEEDDDRVAGALLGKIVARVLINKRYRVWIDKDGNAQTYAHGNVISAVNGSRHENSSSLTEEVLGLYKANYGNRSVTISQSDTLKVTGERSIEVGGNETYKVTGKVTKVIGSLEKEIKGEEKRTVSGSQLESVTGAVTQEIGDDRHVSTTFGDTSVVGGTWTVEVANSQADGTGANLSVTQGLLQIHNKLGKARFTSGGVASSSPTEVLLKPSGTVLVKTANATTMEVNGTGIKISTKAGSIILDQKGSVSIGPPAGGAVITTLTHPVDFVTGIPLLGSTSVAAGGVPGPAAIPPVFIPDPT